MRYISLFAGIGGFDLALNRQGHECVYVNEWDKYAAQTYEKNFKHKPDTRDIKTVSTDEIPGHDLLVGGFPCQSFSIAGKRGGFSDTRGTLFFEIARILRNKRPRHFILENVKGLLSHDSGKTFSTILGVLSDLGYEYQWQVLNSKDFGVPQNRERIFIVGHLRGQPRPKVFPLRSEAETNIGGDKKFINLQLEGAKITNKTRTIQARYHKGYSSRYGENSGVIVPTIRASQHKSGDNQTLVAQRIPLKFLTRNQRKIEGDYAYTVDGANTGGVIISRPHGFNKGGEKSIPNMRFSSIQNELVNGIRRLTPTECERLQGFPDNWTKGVSDTQRYKCLGNAVTVNVVEEIVKRL